jgi:anti-repressor protein
MDNLLFDIEKLTIDSNFTVAEWYTMSQVAKAVGVGRNNLYKFLRSEGIFTNRNRPHEYYSDHGCFKLTEVRKYRRSGKLFKTFPVPLVSGKGLMFIKKIVRLKYKTE